ncbi:MAG: class II glutamine amidotransferase [Oligoflexales bacterium]|nr:class II glutamine amidotransferase [Oligoflexales bacterium]
MCRFIAYKGTPILLDDLLFKPKHSLIQQSYHAQELEEPLNGDGFGIGWYSQEVNPAPAVFVSTTPAWNNRNLKSMSPRIKSNCLFAHVRAASMGDISEANCHPFQFGNWMFMHNGGIEGFAFIKRQVQQQLSNSVFNWLRGQTDSEHFFGMFMEQILPKQDTAGPAEVMAAMEVCVRTITAMKSQLGIQEPTYLNTCVTNGKFLVGTRCIVYSPGVLKEEEAPSLYFSAGKQYVCEGNSCRMVDQGKDKQSAMIVSERLTDNGEDWVKIPENHFVIIHPNLAAQVVPMQI